MRVGPNVHLPGRLGYAGRERPGAVHLWPEARRDRPPPAPRPIVPTRGKDKAFHRYRKQTLRRRRMLGRTKGAAREEPAWAVPGLWPLGMMATSAVMARGGGPAGGVGAATAAAGEAGGGRRRPRTSGRPRGRKSVLPDDFAKNRTR